jgi:hypothetical protein
MSRPTCTRPLSKVVTYRRVVLLPTNENATKRVPWCDETVTPTGIHVGVDHEWFVLGTVSEHDVMRSANNCWQRIIRKVHTWLSAPEVNSNIFCSSRISSTLLIARLSLMNQWTHNARITQNRGMSLGASIITILICRSSRSTGRAGSGSSRSTGSRGLVSAPLLGWTSRVIPNTLPHYDRVLVQYSDSSVRLNLLYPERSKY